MPFTVTMPKLSPTMENGVIAKWHKKVGDKVDAGDVLLEITTDKATVEHSALDEGYLRKILVKEGDEATVNQPIAIFTEEANESIEGFHPEQVSKKEAPKEEVKPASSLPTPIELASQSQTRHKLQPAPTPAPAAHIVASPLAKKLAKDKGIDLSTVKGSGPRGRIVSKDLEKGPAMARIPAGAKPTVESGTFEEIALTPMRKVISKRLQEAKSTIPHFYVTQAINAEPLVNFRQQLSELGIKVSFNDCVIKGCSHALREHPTVNSGFNPSTQTVLQFKTIDISVAVTLPNGLITPIIKHADYKSISEISEEMRSLAGKAKEGKLAPHEFQGGSFTISNLGMYAITQFVAVINPPQAAILAVGGIVDQPVVRENKVVPGKVMNLTLSVDHRVIDGVVAAEFMKTLQKYLENPVSLLL